MASLSNINGLFDVHSTGAILFSTSHGTSGQILRSNGNAAPTWVAASTVIGGPYLPLTGGTLSGPLSGTSLTLSGTLTGTSATFSGNVTSTNLLTVSGDGHLFLGATGETPKIDMMYVDSASGLGWDTRIFTGKTDDLPNGQAFPTSTSAGGYGTQYQANSDGAFFGIIPYPDATSTHYRPVINWGDDVDDSPFAFQFNGVDKATVSSAGVITAAGVTLTGGLTGTSATFSGLVSGITPTAAANFATKAYVDAHPGSGGTVTSVATGTGLTGGTITTTGTLSIDSTVATLAGQQVFTGNKYFNNFFLEFNSKTLANFNDLNNNQFDVSMYDVYNLAVASTGMLSTYGTLFQVNGRSSHTKTQFAFNGGNDNLQYRTSWYPNTAWTSFRQIWDSDNLPNPTQGGPYLPLSGGTLTSTNSNILILNPTANNYGGILFQYGGANKGTSIYNSGGMVYGGESGNFTRLQAGGQYGLHLDATNQNTHIGGTTDAAYKLQVTGTTYTSGNATFAGNITLTPGNSNKIILTPDLTSHYITANGYWIDVIGNQHEVFRVFGGVGGTSEYLRIAGDGNVGIGTTSPDTLLHVKGGADDNESLLYIENTHSAGGTQYPSAMFTNTNGDHSFGTIAEFRTGNVSGADRPSILFTNGITTNNWSVGQGVYSANDNFAIGFRTGHPGVVSAWADPKLVILTSGNVGINNTSPDAYLRVDGTTTVTAARFYGTGGTRPPLELRQNNTAGWFAKFYSDNFGTYVGGISFYGSSTTFNTSSDYRLKENIISISDSITRLKQLKPSRFNFKQYPEITIDGFLAHEVQDVVPEAITGDKDELDSDGKPVYQTIDHSRLIPLLVAAIQELETRVKELENK